MSQVNISGLDKAVVLKALHQNSKAQGMSVIHEREVTIEECQILIANGQTSFDYFAGRVLKVDLSEDFFDSWGYDPDNGEGSAQKVINSLRQ